MKNFMEAHKLPLSGALVGLIIAISFFALGFFKTIVIILLVLGGAAVGYYVQKFIVLNK